jgi:hypothetical protein
MVFHSSSMKNPQLYFEIDADEFLLIHRLHSHSNIRSYIINAVKSTLKLTKNICLRSEERKMAIVTEY